MPIFLDLTFVAKHSFPSVSAEALEREVAVTVDAPRQTHALRTVSSCPADLTLASVGPETHTNHTLYHSFDKSSHYFLTWSNCHFVSTEADRAVLCRRSSHLTSREGRGRDLHSHRCNGRCPESPGRIVLGFSEGGGFPHSFVCVLPRSGHQLNSNLLTFHNQGSV